MQYECNCRYSSVLLSPLTSVVRVAWLLCSRQPHSAVLALRSKSKTQRSPNPSCGYACRFQSRARTCTSAEIGMEVPYSQALRTVLWRRLLDQVWRMVLLEGCLLGCACAYMRVPS